jgi:hypothetical protein
MGKGYPVSDWLKYVQKLKRVELGNDHLHYI